VRKRGKIQANRHQNGDMHQNANSYYAIKLFFTNVYASKSFHVIRIIHTLTFLNV